MNTTSNPAQYNPTKNHFYLDIKSKTLAHYPTTVHRSVCLRNFICVDHSVNRWLYERWIADATSDQELMQLQQEMEKTIVDHAHNQQLEVKFVHLDPRKS